MSVLSKEDDFDYLVKKRDVYTLSKMYFDFEPTPKQCDIIRAIAFQEANFITVKAPTQWGKTKTIAVARDLHKLMNKNVEYQLVASLDSKTSKLRSYVAENHVICKSLANELDIGAVGFSRLNTEISRKRFTYKDGSSLGVHSAQGDAIRLMGHGGDVVIVDETGEIDKEKFNGRIFRMLGGRNNPMLIEIGNPWDPNSHFAEHWDDPRTPEQGGWLKIHVTWQDGVNEGRFTQEFIDEQRRNLSPIEFRVLYDADFPEEAEDQLIERNWFDWALNNRISIENSRDIAGLDVAEYGRDATVLINGLTDDRYYRATEIFTWHKQDTMQTVAKVAPKIKKTCEINIDSTGVGSGVAPRLQELEFNAVSYKGGEKPDRDEERFRNQLAYGYWSLREAFEQRRIDLTMLKKFPVELAMLKRELMAIKYEVQSDRLIRIIKPNDKKPGPGQPRIKSPDHADALMLLVARISSFTIEMLEDKEGTIWGTSETESDTDIFNDGVF